MKNRALSVLLFVAMSISLSAEGQSYSELFMTGTAVEDSRVAMHLRAAEGQTQGTSFETFLQLTNGGTIAFETAEGEVLSSGTCSLTDGIYRILYNTDTRTYTNLRINRLGLVGNVTTAGWSAAGVELPYVGHGVWQATMDLIPHTGTDPERGQFCFNSSWDYTVKARDKVEGIVGFTPDQADCGFTVGDIYMRHGRKEVRLDMQNFVYSIECVETSDEKITFFGSSVCNGQGAEEVSGVKHGYAWQYGQLLQARHEADETLTNWEYSNTSINGNNTTNLLARIKGHCFGDCGKYVVIGLGLGNEGLHEATDKHAVYDQWKTNMGKLIADMQEEGKVVVATNNYPRGDYNATDFSFVKRMNLEMHEWDIPTVNFLGALDNCHGNGRWAEGYQVEGDIYHPTMAGHTEFMHTFVPSLFEALKAGKAKPERQTGEGVELHEQDSIILTPEDTVHSFTIAFRVKNLGGLKLDVDVREGEVPAIAAEAEEETWKTVVMTHYYAAGWTYIYIDGHLERTKSGKILLSKVTLSGSCRISDLHFWRAGMNIEEVAAFREGKMLSSSLELYCPLNDLDFGNRAQSMNEVEVVLHEPSAVEEVRSIPFDGPAYNILGQRVDEKYQGITIKKGKKEKCTM